MQCIKAFKPPASYKVELWRIYVLHASVRARPVERGEDGKVFPGLQRLGAPRSLKNTENDVPGGFFLT